MDRVVVDRRPAGGRQATCRWRTSGRQAAGGGSQAADTRQAGGRQAADRWQAGGRQAAGRRWLVVVCVKGGE